MWRRAANVSLAKAAVITFHGFGQFCLTLVPLFGDAPEQSEPK